MLQDVFLKSLAQVSRLIIDGMIQMESIKKDDKSSVKDYLTDIIKLSYNSDQREGRITIPGFPLDMTTALVVAQKFLPRSILIVPEANHRVYFPLWGHRYE